MARRPAYKPLVEFNTIDEVVIGNTVLQPKVSVVKVKGRRGDYLFMDAHQTKEGRIVVNLVGPVDQRKSAYKQFTSAYVEDIKL